MKKNFLLIGGILFIAFLTCCSNSANDNYTGFTGDAIEMESYDDWEKYSYENPVIKKIPKKVDIVWLSGSVNVIYNNSDEISIQEDANDSETLQNDTTLRTYFYFDETDNSLYVKFATSGIKVRPEFHKNVTVSLPKDTKLEKLRINALDADISLANIYSENLKIINENGNITAKIKDAVKNEEIWTVSGEITLENDANVNKLFVLGTTGRQKISVNGSLESLICENASGEINISVKQVDDFLVRGVKGDVKLNVKDVASKNGEIRTVSGNILFQLPDSDGFLMTTITERGTIESSFSTQDSYDKETKKTERKYLNGSRTYCLGTYSGNIKIKKN